MRGPAAGVAPVPVPVTPGSVARVPAPLGTQALVRLFVRLRWRLLRGAIRHGGAQSFAVVIGLIGSVVLGFVGSTVVAVAARTVDDPGPGLIVVPAALVLAVIALGIIAGVSQPVDPRVIGAEPLTDRQLAIGLLTTSACGPPGIATTLLAVGLFVGATTTVGAIVASLVATLAFLATMLLASRATINLLGLAINRFPRFGQIVIGLVSLCFYGTFQILPRAFAGLDAEGQRSIADVARWTPPGQIGQAYASAAASPVAACGHALLGALWLPALAWLFMVTTRRVVLSSGADARHGGAAARDGLRGVARLVRRTCGSGAVGAIAWRSVRTRMRHPRTALETFIGAGIGLAVVLVPALTRDEVGASAVLVGGAVQLSVLFMAGNSIGSDGPAIGAEILCGLEPEVVVEAKVRSVIVVASPLAVIGPLIAAGITGEWAYFPAGVTVGVAGLLAGAGGAIVQSTMVPIAVPESDNPLASGDSGNGLLAAAVLALVVVSLAVLTIPFGLALVWALSRESVALVTVFSVVTMLAGWVVMRLGRRVAAGRWRTHESEIYDAIIPSR